MRVLLESPYGSPDPKIVERNVRYARACMHDCLMRGEAPFASHLLYTQPGVLRDEIPEERERGIAAGLAMGEVMEKSVIYTDLGFSSGMHRGIAAAKAVGRPVEERQLPAEVLEEVLYPGRSRISTAFVCETQKNHFVGFIKSGEAPNFFLQHVDQCPGCLEAVAREFARQANGIQALAKAMTETRKDKK